MLKTWKKAVSLVLVFALSMMVCVPAFAAEKSTTENDKQIVTYDKANTYIQSRKSVNQKNTIIPQIAPESYRLKTVKKTESINPYIKLACYTEIRYLINNSTGRIENIDSAGEPYLETDGQGTFYQWSGGSPQVKVYSDKVTVSVTGSAYIDLSTSVSAGVTAGLIEVGVSSSNTVRYKTKVKTYHFTYKISDLY